MSHLEKNADLTPQTVTGTENMMGHGPFMSKLPTQLRFMILGDCIASGCPEFMSVSQALHQDGQAIIFRKGVYRMRFGTADDDNGQRPHREARERIQKFDIEIDMRTYNPVEKVIDEFKMFQESSVPGRTCEVRFKTTCILQIREKVEIIELLGLFHILETLSMWIEVDKTRSPGTRPCICLLKHRGANLSWVRDILDAYLGEPEVMIGPDRYCLNYRPSKYAELINRPVQLDHWD